MIILQVTIHEVGPGAVMVSCSGGSLITPKSPKGQATDLEIEKANQVSLKIHEAKMDARSGGTNIIELQPFTVTESIVK